MTHLPGNTGVGEIGSIGATLAPRNAVVDALAQISLGRPSEQVQLSPGTEVVPRALSGEVPVASMLPE